MIKKYFSNFDTAGSLPPTVPINRSPGQAAHPSIVVLYRVDTQIKSFLLLFYYQ